MLSHGPAPQLRRQGAPQDVAIDMPSSPPAKPTPTTPLCSFWTCIVIFGVVVTAANHFTNGKVINWAQDAAVKHLPDGQVKGAVMALQLYRRPVADGGTLVPGEQNLTILTDPAQWALNNWRPTMMMSGAVFSYVGWFPQYVALSLSVATYHFLNDIDLTKQVEYMNYQLEESDRVRQEIEENVMQLRQHGQQLVDNIDDLGRTNEELRDTQVGLHLGVQALTTERERLTNANAVTKGLLMMSYHTNRNLNNTVTALGHVQDGLMRFAKAANTNYMVVMQKMRETFMAQSALVDRQEKATDSQWLSILYQRAQSYELRDDKDGFTKTEWKRFARDVDKIPDFKGVPIKTFEEMNQTDGVVDYETAQEAIQELASGARKKWLETKQSGADGYPKLPARS